ncbi:hypothetical protein [Methanothermococcus sp.]|uniref:hypothetical protein n=1 Tax=Methanothermococcus sp. TaxID=2614238 RepID=UPI0025D7846C|nr:hypothetical protein [Methanothermococcus sp.]
MYLKLEGFIKDVYYSPQLTAELSESSITDFDINECPSCGIIDLGNNNKVAYSKWVSPKRTRSYPFARLYDIFGTNYTKITIIPIIKDEGADSSNNDRINAMTYSWMNLLNIYIVLGWYNDAEKAYGKGKTNLITNQKMDKDYIVSKIKEISKYKMSALHWNTTHFQKDFKKIYLNAVESYKKISKLKNVNLHSFENHLKVLENFKKNKQFDIEKFKEYTLKRSKEAQNREIKTIHELEYLSDGYKGLFIISNYLGGLYYLTADEIYIEDGIFIIQESKNSSKGKLPSINDIKDGLFKLILYSNLDKLEYEGEKVAFKTRLKLTGNLKGNLKLPADNNDISDFINKNGLSRHKSTILKLQKEAEINNIEILIGDNK